MKRIDLSSLSSAVFLLIVLTFLHGFIIGQAVHKTTTPEWYSLNAEKGGFSASFPAKPKFESEALLSGAVTQNTYSYSVGDDFAFAISYFDLPGISPDDSEGKFEAMAKYSFNGMKGTINSSRAVTSAGCSGREYYGAAKFYSAVRMQVFNSGQRSFMVLLLTSNSAKNTKAVSDYFFDSFKISDGCTGGFAPVETPTTEVTSETLEGQIDSVTGWRKLVMPKHEFEVLAPNRTKVLTEQVSVKPLPISNTVYSSDDGATSYLIIVEGEYPSGLVTANTQSSSLDIWEKKFRNTMEKAKITLLRNMTVGGFPGREFTIVTDTRLGRAEIFVTKKRSYLFVTMADKDNFNSVYANRFFGSIKISVK